MKCCICGTIRNCGVYLNKIFENMELLGSLFDDYVIILYYDHSDDDTLNIIKKYQEINSKFLFYINNETLLPYRTFRLALGRNFCIDTIRNHYSDYEYFIVMDCDERCTKNMDLNIMKLYLSRNDWDSLSFMHPDGYYDCWALSIYPYISNCFIYNIGSHPGVDKVNRIVKKIRKSNLIRCSSAFNGLAIYRTNKFINCRYDGSFNLKNIPPQLLIMNIKAVRGFKKEKPIEDCEHRAFHFEAIKKNGAQIRISPFKLFFE
jgi:hypothetical protein